MILCGLAPTAITAKATSQTGSVSTAAPTHDSRADLTVNADLPAGTSGSPYSGALQVSGGQPPYKMSLSGTLPQGLRFDAESGAISGTAAQYGEFAFAVVVRDSSTPAAKATARGTLTVRPRPVSLNGTASLTATIGEAFSKTLVAKGGVAPYRWDLESGTLPEGLELDAEKGTISGTLFTAIRSARFDVRVTDAFSTSASQTVTLRVVDANGRTAGHRMSPAPTVAPGFPNAFAKNYKLDDEVTRLKNADPQQTSKVIVTLAPGAELPAALKPYAQSAKLDIINGQALSIPNGLIRDLEKQPEIARVHYDRPLKPHNYRTAVTVGAKTVQEYLGLTGAGIGVAVIDSGMTSWHDDLTNRTAKSFPYGNQRVAKFVDFVNKRTAPYDDNGHGSHVAGIIAGNGYDSKGEKAGIAPDASIVALKVLDGNGRGTVSNIIAALNWVAVNGKTHNIRVVNMSVGAAIFESYWTDPLTLAAKAVTDKGITVVAAAGNLGKNASGKLQYGAITAPGNAPWVLTVGASSTEGSLTRNDDKLAAYSSSGPTAVDFLSKPDLVAPGTGTISLAVPGSLFYSTKVSALLAGKLSLGIKPYIALSGTSMAAPVVSGTVALMLQANPNLTPNLVKAILQYTAQHYKGYNTLREGAGFLNTLGAVRLAQYYATAKPGARMPVQSVWSKQIIWGNHRLRGGYLNPTGNAWANNIVWGTARTMGDTGDNIVWGTACNDCDNIVWGTYSDDNIVWGTAYDGDNIVWGTAMDDNIVWGTDCGGADCDNIVWGTADEDNIVWGTADLLDNIVWGTSAADNIVWSTSGDDDTTWGSSGEDEVQFSDDADQPLPSLDLEFGDVVPVVPEVAPSLVTPVEGGL